jgi:uncharacterized phiE125 gp8 family phage protein
MTVQAWQVNRVTTATGAASLPITLAELKAHLRITHSAEDAYLTRCLSIGTARAEAYLGVAMVNRTLDLYLNQVRRALPGLTISGDSLRVIALPQAPLSSVTGVYTYDRDDTEAALAAGDYTVSGVGDPANRGEVVLDADYAWPTDLREASAVRVRYVAGFGATAASVPEDYKQAALVMAAAFFANRGDCPDGAMAPVETILQPFDHLRALWL